MIGGYLAFIGFFCGQAGLAMMAHVTVDGPQNWNRFCNLHSIVLLTPGLIGGIVIYMLLRTFRSPYVLPCCMTGLLIAFYSIMLLMGANFHDAREFGWIAPLAEPGEWALNRPIHSSMIMLMNFDGPM